MTQTNELLSMLNKGKQKALADFLKARQRGDKMTVADLKTVNALEEELREKETPQENIDDIILTSTQACNLFAITKETLRLWVKKRDFPRTGRNSYPLKEGFDWYRENYVGDTESNDNALAEEKRLKLVAERKLKELELLLRQGELMFREEVKNEFVQRIHVLKRDMLNVTKQMKSGEAKSFVEKRLRQMMENYSRPSGVLKKVKNK